MVLFQVLSLLLLVVLARTPWARNWLSTSKCDFPDQTDTNRGAAGEVGRTKMLYSTLEDWERNAWGLLLHRVQA